MEGILNPDKLLTNKERMFLVSVVVLKSIHKFLTWFSLKGGAPINSNKRKKQINYYFKHKNELITRWNFFALPLSVS